MNVIIESRYEDFREQFGLFLTHEDIAGVLKRPVASVRRSISKNSEDQIFRELANLKVKVGRRHYFSTKEVVEIMFLSNADIGSNQ